DGDRMRTAELVVPLGPILGDVALRVHDEHAMLPARVDAQLALPSVPSVAALITGARERTHRSVAKRRLWNREGEARAKLRDGRFFGTFQIRKLAAHQNEHAIRILGEDALHGAVGPLFVAFQLGERLWPVGDDFVRAGYILPALLLGDGCESDWLGRLSRGLSE